MKQEYYDYLLDTNICIYYINACWKKEEKWTSQEKLVFNEIKALKETANLYMSEATWGELVCGAEKSSNRERNLARYRTFKKVIPALSVDNENWELFAKIKATLQKKGKPMSDMDILIAATAKRYNLILVSSDADMKNLDYLKGELSIERENWIQKPSKGS